MKVYVDGPQEALTDPVWGFPFSHMDGVSPCNSPERADRILAHFGAVDSKYVNMRGRTIMMSETFEQWGDKYVFFAIADDPQFAYESTRGLKLLGSPLYAPGISRAMGVVQVPLWLMGPAWEIQKDRDFIEELRGVPKTLDFLFLGDMRVVGERDRRWLADVCLLGCKIEHRDPCIWQPGFEREMRDFLRETARARYVFAPRGIGSASARLYEAMMVGSVPIVDTCLDIPFQDDVNSFEGTVLAPEKGDYPYHTLPLRGRKYAEKRKAAMEFWDRYCYLPNCALEIERRYL